MAWHGGYYYESVREGGRVRRVYRGSGAEAHLAAAAVSGRVAERRAAREGARADVAAAAEEDGVCELVLEAALVLSGRRRHKGEWR